MRVVTGSDHAGRALRQELGKLLAQAGHRVDDLGTDGSASVDYPDYAERVARAVVQDPVALGVLVCGTGIGVSVAANKIAGARAALCTHEFMARMARAHNEANIVCLGERVVGIGVAWSIVEAFLATSFEGGRHARRVQQIAALEGAGR